MDKIKNLVQFGFYSKKLLLPFGVAFFQILINIMNLIFNESQKNNILESIDNAFSELIIPIIPLINIFSFQIKDNVAPQRSRLKNFLHFFILSVVFGSYVAINIIKNVQLGKYMQEQIQKKTLLNPHNSGLSSFESLELIFICVVSVILLKYKYFVHHNISIIIFILTSFFIDLILDNFPDLWSKGPVFIILSILGVAIDALDYGYQKHMMDVFLHSYWSVAFTVGLTNLMIFGTITTACLIKGKEKSFEEQNPMFISFFSYFDEVDTGIIVAKHILNFILNFFMNLCRVLTIFYFSPDFILISFTISRMLDIILETQEYVCIIFFVLQFITLMFYLEIFEFNFCGLNKNTRKKIREREIQEMLLNSNENDGRSSTASKIEVSPDYIISDKDRNQTFRHSTHSEEVYQMVYEMKESYQS